MIEPGGLSLGDRGRRLGGGTVGGAVGPELTVSNLSERQDALAIDGPAVITVEGTIDFAGRPKDRREQDGDSVHVVWATHVWAGRPPLLVEANVFDGINCPHVAQDGSELLAVDNVYLGTSGSQDDTGGAFTPPYRYAPDDTDALGDAVRDCSGPR